jgi:hypothetical protein
MEWFERKIVEYVLVWAPYGHLQDEDVFPEFGMSVRQLRARFTAIVSRLTARAKDLDVFDQALLVRARELSFAECSETTAVRRQFGNADRSH